MVTDETPDIEARGDEPDATSATFVTVAAPAEDDRPISPPAKIGLGNLPVTLPNIVRHNPVTAAELLDRAANLLVRVAADWQPPLAETPEIDAWLYEHRELATDG